MENSFYVLHDFMVFTKGSLYYLMGAILLAMVGFWLYLTGRDEDKMIK